MRFINKICFYLINSSHLMRIVLLNLAVVFFATLAQADNHNPLNLDPIHAPFDLARFAEAYIEPDTTELDWSSRLTPTDLQNLPPDSFKPISTPLIGFGPLNNIIHLRIPVANLTSEPQSWVLAFNDTFTHYNAVYLAHQDANNPPQTLLEMAHMTDWVDDDRYVHVGFEMPAESTATLFVSYTNPASSAPLTIERPDGYADKRLWQDIHVFFLLGCLAGVTLLTALLTRAIRRPTAALYVGYIFCVAMHIIASGNLLPILQSPMFVDVAFFLQGWWAITSLSLGLLFQRAFLAPELKKKSLFDQILLWTALSLLVMNVLFQTDVIPPLAITGFASLCLLLIPLNGIRAIISRVTGAWPFFFGCLAITGTFLFFAVAAFLSEYISWHDVTLVLLYGLLFEATALTLAMFTQVGQIRKQREAALRAELRLTQEKLDISRRMAAAAHDIQQPLSSLRMAMNAHAGQAGGAAEIDEAINYLDGIVRSQMAEAKAEDPIAQEVDPMEVETFEIGLILEQLRAMFADEAADRGLSLRIVPTSAGTTGNAFALMRALSNLVSNAVKNTQKGGVLIGCRRQNGLIRICVVDTGSGIAGDNLRTLQSAYTRKGNYDGQGLGLSIVRNLCDENGWAFDAVSKPGAGSIFWVGVPGVRAH